MLFLAASAAAFGEPYVRSPRLQKVFVARSVASHYVPRLQEGAHLPLDLTSTLCTRSGIRLEQYNFCSGSGDILLLLAR